MEGPKEISHFGLGERENKNERKKKKRREERRKGKRRSQVWNLSMELSSFGIESMDTWFGTLYFVYGLSLETPKLISC